MLPRYAITKTEDCDYFVFPNDLIGNSILSKGGYQSFLVDIAKEVIRINPGANVIDVGANIGAFTCPVAKAGGAHVYAFEPQAGIHLQLCANIFLNRLSNVTIERCVLGSPDVQGEWIDFPQVALHRYVDLPMNSGAIGLGLRGTVGDVPEHIEYARRQVFTLDHFLIGNVGVVKIDVEGHEEFVLRGAAKTLANSQFPPILFEAWGVPEAKIAKTSLFNYLQLLGYQYFTALDADNFCAQHPEHPYSLTFAC